MTIRKAEQANYFDTTVAQGNSQGEIIGMLEEFGAESIMVAQGNAKGRFAWMIRFQWLGHTYRFVFTPLECEEPEKITSYGGKRRTHAEQARYQMGRIAVHFVKAVLTAAEAQPNALFGFMELPGMATSGGFAPVAGELDVNELIDASPLLQLPMLVERWKDEK